MAKAAWNRTIVDAAGNVLPGADITVTDERTGTLATLFDDRDGNVAKSNPFVADTNGFARFFADAGVYRVVAESGALSRTWRFQSLLDNGVPITWTEDQVFTGNATVEGDFDIEGNATVEGNFDIDGAIDVDGNANIGGDITVAGQFTIGNLGVTGEATFTDKVTITDDLDVTGDLDVTRDLDVTGKATFTDKVTINDDLDVTGDLRFNSGYGSAVIAFGCRAWVNFNGTGTVAIRASGNVSSVTDNGTGDYTVNFATAMPDANYGVDMTANRVIGNVSSDGFKFPISYSSSSVRVVTRGIGSASVGAGVDMEVVCVSIFR